MPHPPTNSPAPLIAVRFRNRRWQVEAAELTLTISLDQQSDAVRVALALGRKRGATVAVYNLRGEIDENDAAFCA